MSYCEAALRKYLAVFDGTKRDFSEVEHLFDALYHNKFTVVDKCYNEDYDSNVSNDPRIYDFERSDKYVYKTVNREEVKKIHSGYLSKGTTATLIHFRKIGLNCIDVEFRFRSEDDEQTIRVVYSIEDEKLASAREVDSLSSIARARWASDWRVFGVMAKYPTNM